MPVPACAACQYHYEKTRSPGEGHFCTHPNTQGRTKPCSTLRADAALCGPDGIWYVPAPPQQGNKWKRVA